MSFGRRNPEASLRSLGVGRGASPQGGTGRSPYQGCKSKAVVLDTERGHVLMSLNRGDYCTQNCQYSLAFFERDGRTLLVHATDWNRVDISDPRTGELLTARQPHEYQDGKAPPHYLGYFHCGITVSPKCQWITSNGWVWHPWGNVRCWDLKRWLDENVWESEDGPSVTSLCDAAYYWDRPLCWVDEQTVAWWGVGDDDEFMVPAIVLHDMETAAERVIFPGPFCDMPPGSSASITVDENKEVHHTGGSIHFDRWLFAWKLKQGLSAWDLADGSRVYHRPDICPAAYHPGRREFLFRHGNEWSALRFIAGFDP